MSLLVKRTLLHRGITLTVGSQTAVGCVSTVGQITAYALSLYRSEKTAAAFKVKSKR